MSEEKPVLFRPGPGKQGMTELHYAAYCGDGDELARCLAAGMDPNQKDEYRGYTPLLWLMDMAAMAALAWKCCMLLCNVAPTSMHDRMMVSVP